MIALLQRVAEASVEVDGRTVGAIGPGTLALIGVERGDGEAQVDRMLHRIVAWRMFADDEGRMNRNLEQAGGQLLLVSQFTLAADTDSGHRASFTPAAPPDEGRRWFDALVGKARARLGDVPTGTFGAHMRVHLVNDARN